MSQEMKAEKKDPSWKTKLIKKIRGFAIVSVRVPA